MKVYERYLMGMTDHTDVKSWTLYTLVDIKTWYHPIYRHVHVYVVDVVGAVYVRYSDEYVL